MSKKNDTFFGLDWNGSVNKARERMKEQASNVNKVTSETEVKEKKFHEVRIGLHPHNKLEAEEKYWKKPDEKPDMINGGDRFKEPVGFEGIKEEFGYYREWKPNEEPTNTVYHKKREGDVFIERKKVWKDNNQISSVSPQITDVSNNAEIEDTEMTEVESSQQVQEHYQQQTENSNLCSKKLNNFLINEKVSLFCWPWVFFYALFRIIKISW